MHDTQRSSPARSPLLITLVTVIVFLVIDNTNVPIFRALAADTEGTLRTSLFLAVIYGSTILGSIAMAALLFGPQRSFSALGLDGSIPQALFFALSVTAIMLVFFAITAPLALPEPLALTLLKGAILPGIGEEIFYRGFLFGFLFRYARWGFIPAAALVGVLFGAAHLYQGSGVAESAAIFAITAIGAFWFSWLYVEWRYNIWVPAFFHVFMNAWWELFDVSETALGPIAANVVRLVVIIVSVLATIVLAKRAQRPLLIRGKAWLWGGPSEASAGR